MDIKKIRKQYKRNEANNSHSENAVLLAKHFGTPEDLAKAEHILSEHRRLGSIPHDLYQQRHIMSQPLYRIMMGLPDPQE